MASFMSFYQPSTGEYVRLPLSRIPSGRFMTYELLDLLYAGASLE